MGRSTRSKPRTVERDRALDDLDHRQRDAYLRSKWAQQQADASAVRDEWHAAGLIDPDTQGDTPA